MKPIKGLRSLLCGVLCLLIVASLSVSAFAVTDSETGSSSNNTSSSTDTVDSSRIQAAYSFDDKQNLSADVGGKYPLSTKEFGAALLKSATGRHNTGMNGYVHLKNTLFDSLSEVSFAFWLKTDVSEAKGKDTLFLVRGAKSDLLQLQFLSEGNNVYLRLTASDGEKSAICTYDVTEILSEESSWTHLAFTYKKSGTVSLLTLYVNGKTSATSASTKFVDLSKVKCKDAAFHGITADDLYVTNVALEPTKITSLMNQSVDAFYTREANAMTGEGNNPNPPDVSVLPTDKHSYTWAAYLFDGTFAVGTDYHSGDIPATANASCTLIDTAKLSEKFGYAMIRKEGTVPDAYLTLDSRLFYGQTSFTFACWVYRNGTETETEECLLDLTGTGVLRFSPYASESSSTLSAYLEYTDARGKLQRKAIQNGTPAAPKNKWVHYALTVGESGEITVYINGVSVETVSSGVNPASLAFSQCKVVTGVTAYDTARTAVDEVYVTPKVLSDADIRKIHFYGLERYTSEVLPDPGQTGTGDEDIVNPNAPDAVDIAQDAYNKTASITGGFVGTTFDERSDPGRDWNNSAAATLTGGRLTQGVASYGMLLDGASFVRYPMGIFDNAQELTVSLSYFWDGAGERTDRSQRLFDFSRKSSSVTDPTASLFLEMGNGHSGLRLGISDGTNSTYLTCDYNAVKEWTRVTVTVADGKITLYLNDTVAATGDTQVDLSSIAPNFCYLGRSGIKGDPMFTGIIDEVYLSKQALSAQEVPSFSEGISIAINGPEKATFDLWGAILTGIIVVAVLAIGAVIAVIIVIVLRKEKHSPEDEAPLPVPITGAESPEQTVVGPRSARRLTPTEGLDSPDATVKFRKVDSVPSAPSEEMTSKFRKITDENDT